MDPRAYPCPSMRARCSSEHAHARHSHYTPAVLPRRSTRLPNTPSTATTRCRPARAARAPFPTVRAPPAFPLPPSIKPETSRALLCMPHLAEVAATTTELRRTSSALSGHPPTEPTSPGASPSSTEARRLPNLQCHHCSSLPSPDSSRAAITVATISSSRFRHRDLPQWTRDEVLAVFPHFPSRESPPFWPCMLTTVAAGEPGTPLYRFHFA